MYAWKAAAQIPATRGWGSAQCKGLDSRHHDNHYRSCKPTAQIPERSTAKSKEEEDTQSKKEEGEEEIKTFQSIPATPRPLFFIHLDFHRLQSEPPLGAT